MSKSAKHTIQSFNDQHAIGLLSSILASTHRAMPDLKANDKWPNIDGLIEVTDTDGHPIGILKVQVKKLTKQRAKSKSFYFGRKDDKFLDYCLESNDWIPILLIGVDVEREKAYWLHIDHDYLEANSGNRTIKFTDSQVIEKSIQQYVIDWEKLLDLYSSKSKFFDEYKQAYSILADVITPALGRSDKRFVPIHRFLDHTNNLLDYLFPIVKRLYYPGSWKLGFAMYKFTDKELMYSMYPIAEDRNDIQIKEVDKQLRNLLRNQGLGFSMHYSNPILENPERYAERQIREKVYTILENQALNHSGNELLAKEYVYAFLDKFHVQLGLGESDSYKIEDIEYGFYKYLPIWIEECYSLLISKTRNNVHERVNRYGYFSMDILSEIIGDELEVVTSKVNERIANGPEPKFMQISAGNELRVGVFRDFLGYLKQQDETVSRPYKKKDYQRGGGFLHGTLTESDAKHNLEIIFEHYRATYENIIANNFPQMNTELSLFRNYDKILYYFDLSDENANRGHTYNIHKLRARAKDIENEVRIVDQTTSDRLSAERFVNKSIEFEDQTYDSYNSPSHLDFLYQSTPLLNLIYSSLEDSVRSYFNFQDRVSSEE